MKLAVFFPGLGYSSDMPLLYYSSKLAQNEGYEIIKLKYRGFDLGMLHDEKRLEEGTLKAYEGVREDLEKTDFSSYERIIFVSKSIGTALALEYDRNFSINADHILLTPVERTFDFYNGQNAAVFYGTNDPFAESSLIEKKCSENGIRMYQVSGGNHSLETGNISDDIDILKINTGIMKRFMK